MSAGFVFTKEAETEMIEIIDDVSADNPQAAARIGAAIHDALAHLASNAGDVPSPVETRRRLSDPVSHVISVSAASV